MQDLKLEPKDIWNIIIFVSFGMIITMGWLMYNEINSGKRACENTGGEFEYDFPSDYYCDTIPFFKYDNGWDYERELNLSNIIFP